MKKFLLFVLLMLCVVTPFAFLQKETTSLAKEQARIVATECYIYEEANFDKPLLDNEENRIILKYGDSVTLLSVGQESEKFVYVAFGGLQGYVFKYYVNTALTDQEVYPVFNAKVAAAKAIVYDAPNEDVKTGVEITKGTELYLYEGYKKNQDFTAVGFIDSEGRMYYGYLRTADLEPYGINASIITGIVVAVSCVTIILLLIFMKKVKKPKK